MKINFPFLMLALIDLLLRLAFSAQSMRLTQVESGPNLTLLVSGEELGYLEPCGCAEGELGGFSRRASVIQQLFRASTTQRFQIFACFSRFRTNLSNKTPNEFEFMIK